MLAIDEPLQYLYKKTEVMKNLTPIDTLVVDEIEWIFGVYFLRHDYAKRRNQCLRNN